MPRHCAVWQIADKAEAVTGQTHSHTHAVASPGLARNIQLSRSQDGRLQVFSRGALQIWRYDSGLPARQPHAEHRQIVVATSIRRTEALETRIVSALLAQVVVLLQRIMVSCRDVHTLALFITSTFPFQFPTSAYSGHNDGGTAASLGQHSPQSLAGCVIRRWVLNSSHLVLMNKK